MLQAIVIFIAGKMIITEIIELTDDVYQAYLLSFGSKAHLWENFRVAIRMIIVEDWAQLMDLMLTPDDYENMKAKKYKSIYLK
jgi:hypothetical protein